jgi:hypothetical protein
VSKGTDVYRVHGDLEQMDALISAAILDGIWSDHLTHWVITYSAGGYKQVEIRGFHIHSNQWGRFIALSKYFDVKLATGKGQ